MFLASGEILIKIFSKISSFFDNLPRTGNIFLMKTMLGALAVGVAAFIVVGILSRIQKLYEKTFVKKVKDLKVKKNSLEHETVPKNIKSKRRAYNRALRSLKRSIRRVVFFNRNIKIDDPVLLDKSADANLALEGTHTFMDYLNDRINSKKKFKGRKTRRKVISKENETKNTQAFSVSENRCDNEKKNGEIPYTTLLEEETHELITSDEKIVETKNKGNEKKSNGKEDVASIYGFRSSPKDEFKF